MIRKIEDTTNCKINVTLKDGTEYLGKDIPIKPFGEHERAVSFWDGESIIIIPLSEVKHCALYFG